MKNCLLFGILLILVSCDVPARIEINNMSDDDACYKQVYFKNDNNIKDSIVIVISHSESVKKAVLIYDFHQNWTDESIREYTNDLEKVEICSSTDTLLLEGSEEIFEFYRKHKAGLWNKKIKINIK